MSFYSTFAGTNFREWVVSIANFLGKYVNGWRMKQEKKSSSYWYRRVIEYTFFICTNFSCFQLFIPEERKKIGFSPVLIFANQSYQKYFAGTNFREFGSKTRNSRKLVPAKISTPKVVKFTLNVRNFRGKKISRISRICLEFAKLNSREKSDFK